MMASASLHAAAAVLLVLTQPSAGASVSMCSGADCGGQASMEPGGNGDLNKLLPDTDALEFAAYAENFGRKYEHESKEYWLRRGLFEKRSAAVKTHNAKIDRLWQAVAGQFADFTDEERSALRGYRSKQSHIGPMAGGAEMPTAVIAARELLRPVRGNVTLPKEFDWLHIQVAHQVPDQGHCGSCWAVTAKSVLDAHWEIYVGSKTVPTTTRPFSAQQIVSCVPNLRSCGGTGGCEGSTVELAFDWVVHNGCASEHTVPYSGTDLAKEGARCNDSAFLSTLEGETHPHDVQRQLASAKLQVSGGAAIGMQGYHMLPRNKERDLIEALYQHGPIATSVAADLWMEYESGIFNSCPKDVVVDHAVTLYGYGEAHVHSDPLMPVILSSTRGGSPFQAQVTKYWLIRNSWNKNWGEKGFIRLFRFDKEDEHCGQDNNNLEGTGCTGDNNTVTVCGMCGFLWDSVVPHFHAPDPSFFQAHKKQVEINAAAKFVRRES